MGPRLLRSATWIYFGGYVVYVFIAGVKAWPRMTWPEWLTDIALQAGWYGALWPYYFPSLLW
jgi:hypothetical protein